MLRRMFFLTAAGSVLMTAAACNGPTDVKASPSGQSDRIGDVVNIGGPLFAPKQLPPETTPTKLSSEPILIPAHLQIVDKVDLPSQRDSSILFIGTEVPNPTPEQQRTLRRDEKSGKWYRPLEAGMEVKAGQKVVQLDDSEAMAQYKAAEVAAKSAEAIYIMAGEVTKAAQSIYAMKKRLNDENKLSALEYIQSVIEMRRAEATETDQKANWEKAVQDFNKAKINLEFFTIRSTIDGVIQPFSRHPGESVKALETVLQIQGKKNLRAEGMVASGYARRLSQGMPVSIEPTIEEAPRSRRRFHTQAVNAVAISGHEQPLIVSVSEDKTARVWDGRSDYETAIFTHKSPVRSVACSPRGASKHYALTGAEDGKGRLWDLNSPKSTQTPVRELEGGHRGVISAVAFSPDGRTCATADSRDIVLWDVESGNKRYIFPQHHLGEITSLTFTPQSKLVSVARDMTVRIWNLGQDGAQLEVTVEGRSGDVARPGVSHDGRYMLVDIAGSLRLMTVAERRTEGVLETVSEAGKFTGFALFSHNNQLVLTGTQNEGRLSVWRAPTAGQRAVELRHFVPRERMVNFSCAAISPSDKMPFAATGTRNGEVYLWPMPTEQEIVKIPGILKFVDRNSAASTHQVRVWAEFPNDRANLLVGSNVTIVIEPQEEN